MFTYELVLNKKRQKYRLLPRSSSTIDLKTNIWQFVSCKLHTDQWNTNQTRITTKRHFSSFMKKNQVCFIENVTLFTMSLGERKRCFHSQFDWERTHNSTHIMGPMCQIWKSLQPLPVRGTCSSNFREKIHWF